MIFRYKKSILLLCLICCLFSVYYEQSTVSCSTSVTGILDLTPDQLASPDITIRVADDDNTVIIQDYNWNAENSYSTVRASAYYIHKKLKVSIIHDTAPDELQSIGSNAVTVIVSLPEALKPSELQEIIVKSRDSREGQTKKSFSFSTKR